MYPPSGEPEDYVLGEPHNEATSSAIGALWELVVTSVGHGTMKVPRVPPLVFEVTAQLPADMPDFFRTKGVPLLLVTARAKRWLEEAAAGWVDFDRVRLT